MSALPEWWTDPYPEVSSVKTAAEYIDALGGALSRRQDNGNFVLSTGTQELVRADSEAEIDSFLLGFALAHLICERHGLIGRRPAAATAEAQPPAAAPGLAEDPVATALTLVENEEDAANGGAAGDVGAVEAAAAESEPDPASDPAPGTGAGAPEDASEMGRKRGKSRRR